MRQVTEIHARDYYFQFSETIRFQIKEKSNVRKNKGQTVTREEIQLCKNVTQSSVSGV